MPRQRRTIPERWVIIEGSPTFTPRAYIVTGTAEEVAGLVERVRNAPTTPRMMASSYPLMERTDTVAEAHAALDDLYGPRTPPAAPASLRDLIRAAGLADAAVTFPPPPSVANAAMAELYGATEPPADDLTEFRKNNPPPPGADPSGYVPSARRRPRRRRS